jgi:hypothetical protein
MSSEIATRRSPAGPRRTPRFSAILLLAGRTPVSPRSFRTGKLENRVPSGSRGVMEPSEAAQRARREADGTREREADAASG